MLSIPCPVLEESKASPQAMSSRRAKDGTSPGRRVRRRSDEVVVVALVEFIDDVGVVDDQTEVELALSRNGVRPDDGFGAVGQGASGGFRFPDRPIDTTSGRQVPFPRTMTLPP